MNNPSKLQSEAVKELEKQFFEMEMYFERENPSNPLKFVDPRVKIVIKQFISDQIQKAYSKGREEENFVNDLLLECWFQFAYETGNNELWAGGLSTLEHLYDYLKSKGIIDGKGRHIILSIQSKGKMK